MTRFKRILRFSLLTALVAGLALAGSLILDRVVGWAWPASIPAGALELIFPPHSHLEMETVDFHYTVDINSLGYRDRELAAIPPGAFKMAVIGDSFTYGYGVNIEDTWVRRLEENLRGDGLNVITLNLGKPGVGTPHYAEIAERALPILRPDLLIIAMLQADDVSSANDKMETPQPAWLALQADARWPNIMRVFRGYSGTLAPKAEQTSVRPPLMVTVESDRQGQAEIAKSLVDGFSGELKARYDALPAEVKDALLAGRLNPSLINTTVNAPDYLANNAVEADPYFFRENVAKTSAYLDRIRVAAAAYGVEVLVLSVPMGCYVNQHALANAGYVGFKTDASMLETYVPDQAIAEACANAKLPFRNVTDGFRAHRDDPDLYFRLDGHFTAKGCQLFADLVTPIVGEAIRDRAPQLDEVPRTGIVGGVDEGASTDSSR